MDSQLNIKRVALLVDTSTGWGRNIIRGVDRFARERGSWELDVRPYAQVDYIPLSSRWEGDGVIARVASDHMAADLAATGLPVVNVSSLPLKNYVYPQVIANFRNAGRLAAQHFMDRGFRHFAFCGPGKGPHSVFSLQAGFSDALVENGFFCRYLELPGARVSPEQRQDRIIKWLRDQQFPLALFAWSIDAPREVIGACRYEGIRVPEEVAVACSGSMDELILQVAHPSVSCVVTPETSIGYAAADLLAKKMADRSKAVFSDQTILIEPSHVEVRESSDVLAIDDEGLVKALRFMREHVSAGVSVDQVALHAGMSRRTLEQKMKRLMQRSPADEIRILRLNQAKQLLQSTMLSIPEVSERSGFGTVEHFITFFKKSTGVTPLQYAKKNRIL
jgi:LacI family transcriptional regulator